MEECNNDNCGKKLGEKTSEIKALQSIVEDLRKAIKEKDIIIEEYRKADKEKEKRKEQKELEARVFIILCCNSPLLTRLIWQKEMLKRILERFYKGQFSDSNLHASDDAVVNCLNYLVKTFSDNPLKSMKHIIGNKIRFRFWLRSKRNKLTRAVKEGYEKSGTVLSVEGVFFLFIFYVPRFNLY